MHDLNKLFIVSITGKLLTLALFAVIARVLPAEHLAYVALIPVLAPVLLSLSSFGIATLLERDVPQFLAISPKEAYALMRAGYVIQIFSILLVLSFGYFFVSTWAPIVLSEYDYTPNTIAWMLAPLACYMLVKVTGAMLMLEGKAAKYGMLTIYGDISAKAAVLGLYLFNPTDLSIFIGLVIGQLPFVAYGVWSQRAWLCRLQCSPLTKLLYRSLPFYIEGNFNQARNHGDSLLVSSLLGPVAMAGYYIAKMVANQLSVFFNPISSFMVHHLSFQKGKDLAAMEAAFKQVWHLSIPIFIWLACAVAAITPLLIQLIAGEQYIYVWPAAFILCLVACGRALYSFSGRILLLIGNAFERFRITIIQVLIITILISILTPLISVNGVAISWLVGVLSSLYLVKIRSIQLDFDWPSLKVFNRTLLLTLLGPFLSLGSYFYYESLLILMMVAIPMIILTLWFVLYDQSKYEYEQMLLVLPKKLKPFYIYLKNKNKKNLINV
jgi:O-antigen/teichoic acid export membrane protein